MSSKHDVIWACDFFANDSIGDHILLTRMLPEMGIGSLDTTIQLFGANAGNKEVERYWSNLEECISNTLLDSLLYIQLLIGDGVGALKILLQKLGWGFFIIMDDLGKKLGSVLEC